MERLQKYLSRAGVASRRHAETLIVDGRVKVNGKVATVLGTQVDPAKDLVLLDGKLVSVNPDRKYFLFYKPPGVVTTLSDPEGRPTVADYAQETGGRVFPVGRLDYDAEGALLLTDDGDLANKLMHPSHQVPRVYLAKVKGEPDEPSLQKLVDGVRLEDGMAHAVQARIFEKAERNTWVKIVVTEGRQHLVKRLCAAIGHPVVRLYRPAHAGLSVHGLRPGQLRALTNDEIRRVKAAGDGDVQPEPKLTLPARRHGHAAPGFEPEPEEEDTRPEGKRASSESEALPPAPRGGEGRGEGQPRQSRFGGERREARSARSFIATEVRADKKSIARDDRGAREERGGKSFGAREDRGGERSFGGRDDRGGKSFGAREDRGGQRSFGGRDDRGGKSFGAREDRGGQRSFGGREDRGGKSFGGREDRGERSSGGREDRGGKSFGAREDRGGGKGFGARAERGGERSFGGREDRGGKSFGARAERGGERSFGGREDRGGKSFGSRDDRGGREERGGREDRGGKFGERGGRDDRGGKFGARQDRGGKFGGRDDRGGRKTFGSRDDRGSRSAEGKGPSQPTSAPFPGEPGYGRKPRASSGDKPSGGGFRRDDRSGPRFGGRGGKPGGGFKKGGFKGRRG